MQKIIGLFCLLILVGCETNKVKLSGIDEKSDPKKEQKVSTLFPNEGVKIIYTTNGSLEAIEVTGQAPAWKKSVSILAEADAMDKLNKFINGKSVSSEQRTKIISRSIDVASDSKGSLQQSSDSTVELNAAELESDLLLGDNEKSKTRNTNYKKAQALEKTVTSTISTIKSEGFLVGVRKISEATKNDGQTYVALYRWSLKDMDAAAEVRDVMRRSQQK